MIGVYYDSLLEDGEPKKNIGDQGNNNLEGKETHLRVWFCSD
jgi:hypothetical protein